MPQTSTTPQHQWRLPLSFKLFQIYTGVYLVLLIAQRLRLVSSSVVTLVGLPIAAHWFVLVVRLARTGSVSPRR